MTVVSCRQLAPVIGDLAGNSELVRSTLADATARADVVVLPELATSGYVFASAEEARDCAIGADDPWFTEWAAAIHGDAVAVVGFAELGADGHVYNSAAVLGRDGLRGVHRKAHLWDREKLFFRPGAAGPLVLDTTHGRLAVLICYDAEFPEYTRTAVLAGADLIAVPTNWPLVDRPSGERPPEVLIAQATARVNRVAMALCDRDGTERGQEWTAGTTIVDSHGWVVGTVGGDQVADLDLTAGRDKQVAEHADLLGDRRPELYQL